MKIRFSLCFTLIDPLPHTARPIDPSLPVTRPHAWGQRPTEAPCLAVGSGSVCACVCAGTRGHSRHHHQPPTSTPGCALLRELLQLLQSDVRSGDFIALQVSFAFQFRLFQFSLLLLPLR